MAHDRLLYWPLTLLSLIRRGPADGRHVAARGAPASPAPLTPVATAAPSLRRVSAIPHPLISGGPESSPNDGGCRHVACLPTRHTPGWSGCYTPGRGCRAATWPDRAEIASAAHRDCAQAGRRPCCCHPTPTLARLRSCRALHPHLAPHLLVSTWQPSCVSHAGGARRREHTPSHRVESA